MYNTCKNMYVRTCKNQCAVHFVRTTDKKSSIADLLLTKISKTKFYHKVRAKRVVPENYLLKTDCCGERRPPRSGGCRVTIVTKTNAP